jgi:VIT1/CCC1 family predicted Fe2+/Mn2+ transporter
MASPDVSRYRDNWQDEVDGAAIYRAMAAAEGDQALAEIYGRLAETEERHAAFWAERLDKAGGSPPAEPRPSWRARFLIFLSRRLGPGILLSTMTDREQANQHAYDDQPEAGGTPLAAEEQSHARLLDQVSSMTSPGVAAGSIAKLEGRHRAVGGNTLRAAVLGANDGLVSNLSLVMGVAGASVASKDILITGLAGLLAGACSMAMGEWISVQSSRELYQRQLTTEREEIREFPEGEREELALLYRSKGLPEEEALRLADQIMSDENRALDEMARQELGIDPEELGGSAWIAAGSSFVFFIAGAIIPVAPYFFLAGGAAVATTVVASALGLLAIGALITVMTGRSALFSGVRQLLIGLAAAGVTFGIGSLIGAAVG